MSRFADKMRFEDTVQTASVCGLQFVVSAWFERILLGHAQRAAGRSGGGLIAFLDARFCCHTT